MGIVTSFQLRRADRRMAKTLVFVKCAFAGDVVRLQEIMAKDKVLPNAQDGNILRRTLNLWPQPSSGTPAAYGGELACIRELLQAGASLTVVDDNGRNALHHACRKDQDEIVLFLLTEAKMNVNSLSESKDTPLHKAVIGKSIRCLEILLHFGADPTLRNDHNRTALDELDADPSIVKDVLPEPISTARMQEELDHWRREFVTEVKSSGSRKLSVEALLTPTFRHRRGTTETLESSQHRATRGNGNKYAAASNPSMREMENTLVTSFRARISEFSDRTSSAGDLSSASPPSSAQFQTGGLWAKSTAALAVGSSGSSASDSSASSGRRDSASGKAAILPLNLQGLHHPADTTSAAQKSATTDTSRCSSQPSIRTLSEAHDDHRRQQKRDLRYAGKRVIMAMRVKKVLSGDEKREMIRLLLLRYMKTRESATAVPHPHHHHNGNLAGSLREEGNSEQISYHETSRLAGAASDFTISLPPNF